MLDVVLCRIKAIASSNSLSKREAFLSENALEAYIQGGGGWVGENAKIITHGLVHLIHAISRLKVLLTLFLCRDEFDLPQNIWEYT